MAHDPIDPVDLLAHQVAALRETGVRVPAGASLAQLEELVVGETAEEPSAYASIVGTQGEMADLPVDPGVVFDKIHAGWLGRCAGNGLGKPFESALWTPGLIRDYLKTAGAWPLTDYAPVLDPMPARFVLRQDCYRTTTRGNVDGRVDRRPGGPYPPLDLHVTGHNRGMATILLTGAGGSIGGMLRERLGHHELRLTDVEAGEGIAALDVTDAEAVERACRGVDAIVHLGGIASEGPFEDVLAVNVRGTERVLQAAQRTGVPRVILASSNHAAGLYERTDQLADDVAPRPDSYYGWSKAAMESLGRLYHDRFGLHVICLRIGACKDEPAEPRDLWAWLSPDDVARLVEASLTATGWHLVWGVSANKRRWWSDAGGRAIGYQPRDDAEAWAATVGEPDPAAPENRLVGGPMPTKPLG